MIYLDAWNEMAGRSGVPKASHLSAKRNSRLTALARAHGGDAILLAIAAVARSPGLCGKNDRGWRADLDFLLREDRFVKILEGGYDQWRPKKSAAEIWAEAGGFGVPDEQPPLYDGPTVDGSAEEMRP